MSCVPRRLGVDPIAEDGNELRFCSTCAFYAACLQNGYTKEHLKELHVPPTSAWPLS